MACATVKLPDGGVAIVCGLRRPKRKCGCGAPASLLCDWKLGGGKTCDRPICPCCAQVVAPGKHLCREHQQAYREWRAARAGGAS